jgi:5-methylcytosine-specific restriction enzyme A
MAIDRFLHTSQWRKPRDRFFRAHPLCRCGRPGVIVDHRIPRSVAPQLALEWSNLETLCRTCHGEKSGADKRGETFRINYGCDEQGNPLDPAHLWNSGKSSVELALLERKRRMLIAQESKPKGWKRAN